MSAGEHFRTRFLPVFLLTAAMVFLLVSPAHADIGVPMLAVVWPISWLLLLVIIPLETFVADRVLRTDARTSLKIATVANLVSTLAGIPLTWLLLVCLELLVGRTAAWGMQTTWQRVTGFIVMSPWFSPYTFASSEREAVWMVPVAAAIL